MAKVSRGPQSEKQKIIQLLRGEIYVCSFDPTIGHEIKKTRPALIVQNDIGNRYSPLTIVAAITSAISPVPYPVEVILDPTRANGLMVRSSIRLDQIRTIDRQRLIRRLGIVDAATMGKVDKAIQISLGLVQI
ncbi:MAG: type II toxin-antitoxin system PemK/MazF family toxin [Acidobacteriaceae bacterium]|nr:type II toxin-antitoxin system PemK/MazF family toxin [Acidobacteriaceae bacterium]MBV9779363.1 type II toxin-antitoxin system PemK/MazF family toxin [Acidobacteriaceae bacterium]